MSLTRRSLLTGAIALGAAGAVGPPASASTTYTVVNCTNLNVRSGPSTSYGVVGTLPVGSVITGTPVGSWVRIESGSYAGRYVSSSYLRAGTTAPAPSPYTTRITPVTGGVYLRSGWNGTRVYLVQKRLGMERFGSDQTYDTATRNAVIAFQRSRGLAADGVVGPATWSALATGHAFTIDAHQVQPQLGLDATPRQRVEKLIEFALAQRGSRYTWGGAGPYALGFDCSGLVLQGLYAAGLDPQPINVLKHAEPTYRTSRELYASTRLQSVPVEQRRRGDLIFYANSSGVVHHVTVDLGDGTMMEAFGRVAGIRPVLNQYGSSYLRPYVKRAFPG